MAIYILKEIYYLEKLATLIQEDNLTFMKQSSLW